MQRFSQAILAALACFACAPSGPSNTPPPPEVVTRVYEPGGGGVEMYNVAGVGAREIPAPIDSVWMSLPRVYEMLEIPDVGAEPDQRLYGNLEFRARRIEGKRLSTFIDCGMGATAVPYADDYQITMSVSTRLESSGNNATTAITTVSANGRPRAVSGNPVHCSSKGTLETRVADLVMYVLLGGRSR